MSERKKRHRQNSSRKCEERMVCHPVRRKRNSKRPVQPKASSVQHPIEITTTAPQIVVPASPPPVVNVPAPAVTFTPPAAPLLASPIQAYIQSLSNALEPFLNNPLGIEVITAQGPSQQSAEDRSGILRAIYPGGIIVLETAGREQLHFFLGQIIGFRFPGLTPVV